MKQYVQRIQGSILEAKAGTVGRLTSANFALGREGPFQSIDSSSVCAMAQACAISWNYREAGLPSWGTARAHLRCEQVGATGVIDDVALELVRRFSQNSGPFAHTSSLPGKFLAFRLEGERRPATKVPGSGGAHGTPSRISRLLPADGPNPTDL